MVRGNVGHGDYFIDCSGASQSALRAVVGVWVNVYIAVIAFCIRSIFRSRVKRQLFANDAKEGKVRLWNVSPATTTSEFFELRTILLRGNFPYLFASLACVIAAIVSAAATVISNHAVVSNVVTRQAIVQGHLVTREHLFLAGAAVNITSRIHALDNANAPLTQAFDFAPEDTSRWAFVPHEWNNTWTGSCNYNKHDAVELVVSPTNSTKYQDEVPSLGNYLPAWARADPMRQGTAYAGFFDNANLNGTGNWRDLMVTYIFGSTPDVGDSNASTVNISIANFLAHNVARDPNTTFFQTAFKSDVHVAECTFNNAVVRNEDQARVGGGHYTNAAENVAYVYQRSVIEASISGQSVIQPTAQQMLRYWQAFLSFKDAQYIHPVQRTLSVSRQVVQIRLSFLVVTIGTFLILLVAASIARFSEPLDTHGKRLLLPSSQLDWIVQAAHEHHRGNDVATAALHPLAYAAQHGDLIFSVAVAPDGQHVYFIESEQEQSVPPTTPKQQDFDPASLIDEVGR